MPVPTKPGLDIGPELEIALAAVEARLAALADALKQRDPVAVDRLAAELHRALEDAVGMFGEAAGRGSLPLSLRTRLASASGLVAAQRESLARATAALDRAIDVLMPRGNCAVYDASGSSARLARSSGTVA
jgi:hypothetical protein